jgi:hypothetical protein
MPAITTSAERTAAAPPPLRHAAVRREARLRPEHSQHYPGLPIGQWEAAAILADRVLASRVLRGRDLLHAGRILVDAHFEFRGGDPRASSGAPARPRREDR